ncbi:hypothetical protein ACI6Q5_18295 [Xanthomonas codiaei]|uniref:Uncharacterized protein n=1 Tax=Xanthomonas codiaei TaxID=56463 RepID=A0A2S7CPP3_9XANT|nr:hypothetical protein [Xanthomonas codiaei]PPU63557.1 hypothetical protein XcodCFBP4690_12445 [Xanthomonas codiaei]
MALAIAVAGLHLGWEFLHGGVRSHHLLNRADLPTISNWWGLLVLPGLGALAGDLVSRRASGSPDAIRYAVLGAVGAMAAGIVLSAAFVTGSESATSAVFLCIVAASLVVPAYRAEYLFGFVLGMTFVFGAVLPTLFGLLVVAASAIAWRVVYPLLAGAVRWARR